MSQEPEKNLQDLLKALDPMMNEDQRGRAHVIWQKLMSIDTYSWGPAGKRGTNYHGEAYADLAKLAAELSDQHPKNVDAQELLRQYGAA
jgi:hypothetical protein